MSPSSISSSERFELALTRRGLGSLLASALVAVVVVAAAEVPLHALRTPKALPFESARTGTLVEALLARRGPPLDVLFLGSSQCAGAVSVADLEAETLRLTGRPLDAFNAGIPGANVLDMEQFDEVVASRVAARRVVLLIGLPGMAPRENPGISRSYGMDWLRGRLSAPHDLLMRTWLFRYRRLWRDARWQFYVLRTRRLEGDLVRRLGPDGRGWLPAGEGFGVLAPTVNLEADVTVPPLWRDWEVPAEVVASLQRTIAAERARGRDVVVVVPPLAPRSTRIYGDVEGHHARLRAALATACQATGTPWLDMHAPPEMADADFHDSLHVTPSGARRFSRLLARELARLEREGALPAVYTPP